MRSSCPSRQINRTPHARDAFYRMQRALQFDFAIPDVTRIKSVGVPTLIVWGRNDRVVDVRTATRFQQDIADSQLVVIDDTGHQVHEEKPDAVNRAILTVNSFTSFQSCSSVTRSPKKVASSTMPERQ